MISQLCIILSCVGAVWTTEGTEGFLPEEPELENVAVHPQGAVTLAPELTEQVAPDEASVWALAETRNGTLYFGTGDNGRVYRLEPNGTAHTVFDAGTGEILAVCTNPRDDLFFGISPGGTVYRIQPGGEPASFLETGQDYVFALLPGPDGEIYCATGSEGKLYRISPRGTGEIIFAAPQTHITALAWLKPGKELLVGTAPDGLVYRLPINPRTLSAASVLYDTPLAEVRSLAVTDGRLVHVAANPDEETEDESNARVYCIDTSGIVRWEWTSPGSTVFSLLPAAFPSPSGGGQGEGLLVTTGTPGAIYRLDTLGRQSLIHRTTQTNVVALAEDEEGIWVGTTGPARVSRMAGVYAKKGHIISRPFDCEGPSRFGRFEFRADIPAGTGLEFDTRSGNSETPDSTWNQWQPAKEQVRSSSARFIQWRARFSATFPGLTPTLRRVDLYYRIPNRRPAVAEFRLAHPGTLEPSTPGTLSSGTPSPIREFTWDATDPDGDSLESEILFLGEGETRWKPAATELTGGSHEFDTRTLPDGWYRFRLRVSDRPSRPTGSALNVEATTLPLVIDNTPPQVSNIALKGNRLSFTVQDATTPIVACRVSTNAGPWQPVEPQDGIFDTPGERFSTTVELEPGENTIAVRAFDAHGNNATASRLVRH